MKRRFILYRRKRGGMFYLEDTETHKQETTSTRNRAEATALLNARNESFRQPQLNLQIAKAYLAGTDAGLSKRTWQDAFTAITENKHGPTQERWQRAIKQKAFDLILPLIIIETQAEQLVATGTDTAVRSSSKTCWMAGESASATAAVNTDRVKDRILVVDFIFEVAHGGGEASVQGHVGVRPRLLP
ncbi:MAG: hypothetical protein WAO21_11600 [Verrucomicrobiia bacterium]